MASMVLATMIAGMAKITMNAVTSIAHTKSGTRLSDMPGARSFSVVTTSSTAPTSAASSVKVIIWAHTSMRLPGAWSGPASGT